MHGAQHPPQEPLVILGQGLGLLPYASEVGARAVGAQPKWLLVVLPVFAVTFLGFDRLADGVVGLVASGEIARLAVGAVLMAGPAFAVGFALGCRARRPSVATVAPTALNRATTAPEGRDGPRPARVSDR